MGAGAVTIRVAVVDDHQVVRAGVRALLDAVDGVEVVAEADSGRSAVRVAVEDHPDVLILDLSLPDAPGVEVARRVRVAAPGVAIVVLTMLEDEATVGAAVRAGVSGYLLKGSDAAELVETIRLAAAGRAVYSPSMVASALREPAAAVAFPDLTAREREVLELIAQGAGNAAIASRLHISPKTVGNHVTSIFHKLAVVTRVEAAVAAREAGMGRRRELP